MNPLMYPAATSAFTNQLQTRRPVTEEARRTALSQALQEKMRSDPRYDQISAMREQSMTPFGVGAGWTGVAAQLANALAANVSEKRLNKDYQGQQEAKNAQMAQLLELYSPAPVEGAGNGPEGMDGAQQQRIASALDQPDNSGFSINAQRDADPKRAALAALLANPDMQDAAGGMILKSAFDPKEKTKYETVEGPDGTYAYDPTRPNETPIKITGPKPKKDPSKVDEYEYFAEQFKAKNPGVEPPDFMTYLTDVAKAGRSVNSNTTITGQKDPEYGEPPKDMTWARQPGGQVMTEEVPGMPGVRRPIAVPIKGSKDDYERQAGDAKAGTRAADQQRQGNIVLDNIKRAKDAAGFWTTGYVGDKLADVAGTPAHDLQQTVSTIKANIGFDALQKMRDSSPTGAGLGAISDRETALLQSTLAAVEQSQSPGQFKQNMNRLESVYDEVVNGKKQAAQQQGAAQPGQYSHTATDDKGNKIGWDGSKWVPVK